MLELPETINLGKQINDNLKGKTISNVFITENPSKMLFLNGTLDDYKNLLTGRKIISGKGAGMFVDIIMDGDMTLTLCDGIIMKYGDSSSKLPDKYQVMLTFEDNTFLSFNIAMYGGIQPFRGTSDNPYHEKSFNTVSPLEDEFDEEYFESLISKETKNISVKALLATEQRIPGIGNGSLQDILFNSKINPKRKIKTLSESDKKALFNAIKSTLKAMTEAGGRDAQTDIFGNKGGYKTILSSKTAKSPCPRCGDTIVKENYMGGAIYYCPTCQPL
ncbi:MAG: endonuclease VIII [Dysgonomonas sp.]|nr:endonuclease VIII [Dysgonomonas sp.]